MNHDKPRAVQRVDVLAISLLAAVLLLYFRSLIWTDEFIYGELDIRRSLYLFRQIAYETMRSGEAPLWIKHLNCGMPLLGGALVTPFYLPDLLFMWSGLPLNVAFNWDLILHLMAGQIFSYLFFLHLLKNRAAALFSSMWFWNAFFLGSVIIGDALNIRAMLLVPVVFYFVEAGLGDNGRAVHLWLGALALSFQLLSGGLQFVVYTMTAVSLYTLFLLIVRARQGEEVIQPAMSSAALAVVALAISAIQLVPGWEYSRLSVRSTAVPWFRVWALEPHLLLEYVIPMSDLDSSKRGYFGIIPLVLAAHSIASWRDKKKYFFIGLAALSLLYSLGGHTRISTLLAGLPLLRQFRGPARAALFFNLSVFVLAGGGLTSLYRNGTSARRDKVVFALVSLVLGCGFIIAAFLSRNYSDRTAWGVAVSGGFLIVSVIATSLFLLWPRFKRVGALTLVALLFANLAVVYANYYSPTKVSEILGKDRTVDYLKGRIGPFRIAAYNTAHTNYLGLYGMEVANGHHPFPTIRAAEFFPLLTIPKIASLAGVKYNVLYRFKENGQPYNPPVQNQKEVVIEPASLEPLPRVFLVATYRVFPAARAASALALGDLDPSREAILEESLEGFESQNGAHASGSATIVARTANEVSVSTSCERAALLVLSESYYPGWQAEVDGQKAKVLVADCLFRAVQLPPGNHAVVFRFRPKSFMIGAGISCVGIVCWVIWGILLRRKHPSTAHPETH